MSEIALDRSEAATAATSRGWIVSPAFDSILIIFAPLTILPVMVLYKLSATRVLGIGIGLTLAFAHYFSSTVFYFWKESSEYHRQRWLAFFAGPVILALVYGALMLYRVPNIIQFVLFFWTAFHVARQNSGILSTYRHRSGSTDPAQRNAANRAILAISVFIALWNIDTHVQVTALFNAVGANTVSFVRFAAGAVALITLIHLAVVFLRRWRMGQPPAIPEVLFLMVSLGFFYPYLVIRSSEMATVAMLLPHYVQYMGIVWLIHRRKFGNQPGAAVPAALRALSSKLYYLIPTLLAIGAVFAISERQLTLAGKPTIFETTYLFLAFEHYYLDGLIWSFKRAHVRQTIAPALLGRPAAA
jgi:hypothetical protein